MNDFTIFNSINDLDSQSIKLMDAAKKATDNAYAPYSNFHVGAAVLLEDGTIVTGTNQENAAYPSGMCAERVALFTAVSQHPGKSIVKLAVIARRKNEPDFAPATSCGPCRQVMLEFELRQQKAFEVIMFNHEQQWIISSSAKALLPFCFTPDNLKAPKH